MFKQVSNQLESSIKSCHHETESKQVTNRNKQANLASLTCKGVIRDFDTEPRSTTALEPDLQK